MTILKVNVEIFQWISENLVLLMMVEDDDINFLLWALWISVPNFTAIRIIF